MHLIAFYEFVPENALAQSSCKSKKLEVIHMSALKQSNLSEVFILSDFPELYLRI